MHMAQQLAELDILQVITAVKAGDVDAYGEIVRRYQKELFRITVVALRDMSTTEDLVQEAFVKAYLNLDRYDPSYDFGTWLRTVCRNLVRNELRRLMRDNAKMRRYYQHVLTCIEDDDDAEVYERSMRDALALCRDELAPAAAQAVALRYEQAKEFDEIAGILGRTVAACRQLLTRVRLELRKCIARRLHGQRA